MTPPFDADELVELLNSANDRREIRQTHVSIVYLTERSAYKQLRPVQFEFLDFGSREARYVHLANEARLNRRLAPQVYQRLVPLWGEEPQWSLHGAGPPADWLLPMQRLPDEATLEARLRSGTLVAGEFDRLTLELARFFRSAACSDEIAANGDPAILRRNLIENLDVLDAAAIAGELEERLVHRLRSSQLQTLLRLDDQLRARMRQGWIRDGHGDLRAEHVYLTDPVQVIDCIAFNHRLRWIDAADDVSFLATDLVRLGGRQWAERLIANYRELLSDPVSDELLNFYRSYRFAVRAKVALLRRRELSLEKRSDDLAQDFAALATDELAGCLPWLLAVCGLSGTGKTTLAAALAERIGAVHLSSDRVRKELFGLAESQRGDPSHYSPEADSRTYAELLARADRHLAEGTGVVLDATFLRRSDRDAARSLAENAGRPLLFVECRTAEAEIANRLARRAAEGTDVSDATLDVWQAQRRISDGYVGLPPMDHVVVETGRAAAMIVDEIVTRLKDR